MVDDGILDVILGITLKDDDESTELDNLIKSLEKLGKTVDDLDKKGIKIPDEIKVIHTMDKDDGYQQGGNDDDEEGYRDDIVDAVEDSEKRTSSTVGQVLKTSEKTEKAIDDTSRAVEDSESTTQSEGELTREAVDNVIDDISVALSKIEGMMGNIHIANSTPEVRRAFAKSLLADDDNPFKFWGGKFKDREAFRRNVGGDKNADDEELIKLFNDKVKLLIQTMVERDIDGNSEGANVLYNRIAAIFEGQMSVGGGIMGATPILNAYKGLMNEKEATRRLYNMGDAEISESNKYISFRRELHGQRLLQDVNGSGDNPFEKDFMRSNMDKSKSWWQNQLDDNNIDDTMLSNLKLETGYNYPKNLAGLYADSTGSDVSKLFTNRYIDVAGTISEEGVDSLQKDDNWKNAVQDILNEYEDLTPEQEDIIEKTLEAKKEQILEATGEFLFNIYVAKDAAATKQLGDIGKSNKEKNALILSLYKNRDAMVEGIPVINADFKSKENWEHSNALESPIQGPRNGTGNIEKKQEYMLKLLNLITDKLQLDTSAISKNAVG